MNKLASPIPPVAGHVLHMLRTPGQFVAGCECLTLGPRRNCIQVAYADHIDHVKLLQTSSARLNAPDVHQPTADSCPGCGQVIAEGTMH